MYSNQDMKVVEGHTKSMALWDIPITDTAVQGVHWVEYRPMSQITSASTLEFNVPNNGMNYIDLKRTRLMVKFKVVKGDGGDISSTLSEVAPLNLAHSTIFSQIDVLLQQKLITRLSPPHYAYKAYLDTLMLNSTGAKGSYLQNQFWHADSPGGHDIAGADPPPPSGDDPSLVTSPPDNIGWTSRALQVRGSAEVQLEGGLHVDVMSTNRYLLNGVSLTVRCWQAPDAFRLMSYKTDADFKLVITDAVLKVAAVTVNPDVILAHDHALRKSPALYPYLNTDFKSFSIAKGQFSFSAENLYLGQVPSKMFCVLVPAVAYNGNYHRNPLNFLNCDVSYMSLKVDGKEMPSKAIETNFEGGNYSDAYMSLCLTTDVYGNNFGNMIGLADYDKGFTVFGFDLDSQHNTSFLPSSQRGNCKLEVNFRTALKEPVNLIIYSKHPSCIKIDHSRGVFV